MKKHLLTNSYNGGGILDIKSKNAFTLIELLAIIVILAIIAVITVPIILNIIENSRMGAATDSAYGYKDSVNKTYITELSKPNQEGLKLNGTYEVQADGTLEAADTYDFGVSGYDSLPVAVSGDKPSSGSLTYENNVLKSGWLVIGDYKVTFNQDGTVTTVKNASSNNNQNANANNDDEQVEQNVEPLAIGTTIAYSTSLNGVTLNNWKVFLSDEEYTYLIYGDYFPNAAVNITGIDTLGTYDVCTNEDRETFIALMSESYWRSMLTGTLNGTISIDETLNENALAIGTPDLALWVDSWNITYPSYSITISQISLGYYIQFTDYEDSSGSQGSVLTMPSETTEFQSLKQNASLYKLYFPHNEHIEDEGTFGYWLSSPSAEGGVSYVCDNDSINFTEPYEYSIALRPVIKLPTSVVNQ